MADDQKPVGQPVDPQNEPQSQRPSGGEPQKKPPAQEVSATDLLSLWGKPASKPSHSEDKPITPRRDVGATAQPQVAPKPAPIPRPAPAPQALPKPAAPAPAPPKPAPVPQPAPAPAPAPPKPLPESKPLPEPKPEPTPPPKLPETKKVYEGEVLSGPKKPPAPRPASSAAAAAPTPHEPEPELLQEKEGFGAQVDEFLAELNLSRKHIFYGLGCIVLLVILVWGGFAGYRYYKNRKTSEAPPPPSTEISKEQTGIPVSTEIGQPVVATKEMVGDTGIISTIAVGQTEIIKTEIAYYIMTFRRLQNAYETNIDNLLNQSTDRRAKLRSHLAILKKLHADGTQLLEQIKNQIEKIKQDYEPQRQMQETTDVNFFEQLNAFNAQTAEDILDKFIEASKHVVALRAKFKSLQKVAAFYEEALPKLAARIRDIELNEEALISGIKIYDVKGSDLKLIVPVINDGAAQDVERLSSPAFPLIPINPADIKPTGRDFITQPGGGF